MTYPTQVRAYLDLATDGRSAHPYAALLGLPDSSSASLHQRVKEGLPFAALGSFQQAMAMSASTLAEVLHLSPRTFQRRKESGVLLPDESDRLLRLSRLVGRALELFEGDLEATRAWLGAPVAGLGGGTPLELAQSEPGAREVELLIARLEHGVFA